MYAIMLRVRVSDSNKKLQWNQYGTGDVTPTCHSQNFKLSVDLAIATKLQNHVWLCRASLIIFVILNVNQLSSFGQIRQLLDILSNILDQALCQKSDDKRHHQLYI